MEGNAIKAALAYAQALDRGRAGGGTGAAGGMGESAIGAAVNPGQGFGGLLRAQFEDVVSSGRAAEQQTIKAVQGKADVVDVVTAVNNAEMALQTVVAVRDRMVQAYQEILRMPI